MADPTKILVVFDIEDKELTAAADKFKTFNSTLASTVKVVKDTQDAIKKGAVGFSGFTKAVDEVQKGLKGMIPTLDQLDESTRHFVDQMIEGLAEGFVQGITAAKQELADFIKKQEESAEKGKKNQNALQAEYKKTNNELAALVASGVKEGAQYDALKTKTAQLKAEIGDLNAETRQLATSGLGFRALAEGVGLVTGAFGIATGAQALFGQESEELNEVLTRLNAITAINTSLEQINNALKKEGALATAALAIQTKVLNVQKQLENAVTSESVIVRNLATAAQWALNTAMAANPIGIVIVALTALVAILFTFIGNAREAKEANDEFNLSLKNTTDLVNADIKSIDNLTKQQNAASKQIGEAESTRIKNTITAEQKKFEIQGKAINDLIKLNNDALTDQRFDDDERTAFIKANEAAILKLREDQKETYQRIFSGLSEFEIQRDKEAKEAKEKLAKQAEENEKRRIDNLKKSYDDQIAAQERIVLKTKEGSEKNIAAQAQIIRLTAQKTLDTEKLTQQQRLLINERAEKEIVDLKVKYNKIAFENAIDNEIKLAQARLSDPALSIQGKFDEEEKIRTLNYQKQRAALEAQGFSTLALDKQIQNERIASAGELEQKLFEQKEAFAAAEDKPRQDALQRMVRDENIGIDIRKNASKAIFLDKQDALTRESRQNEKQFHDGVKTQDDFLKAKADIDAEVIQNERDQQEEQTAITKKGEEERMKARLDAAAQIIDFAQQAVQLFTDMSRNQTERELQAIDFRRERLEGLRETGSITEKEYLRNLKVIDAEEKKIQNEAAKREKVAAIFSAVLNTAAAVVKALPNIPLSIIVGALGLAQVALIASKPVPKFKGGTKHSPEGLAMVGEGGSELIHSGGRMFLTPPQASIVWLKRGSQVLTAQQTRSALSGMPSVNRAQLEAGGTFSGGQLNPGDLAKAIGANLSQINITIDKDGFALNQQKGLNFTTYLNDRYKI